MITKLSLINNFTDKFYSQSKRNQPAFYKAQPSGTDRFAPSFKGKYDPSNDATIGINNALSAGAKNSIGESLFIQPALEEALLNYINKGNISDEDFSLLDRQKTRISNFYSLVTNNKPVVKDSKDSTRRYLEELKSSMQVIEKTFKELKLSDEEINLFKHFVAKTSPILYFMGYPDEVAHPAQVARRNAIEADRMGANSTEILKSALVGWLHDPKFDSKICWDNLATHPIIAHAIADRILNEPDLSGEIAAYLGHDKEKIENFKFGIKEALLVNNDSKFVLDNAILNAPPFPVIDSEGGLNHKIKSVDKLNLIAFQRFYAPSKGEPVPVFSDDMKAEIENEHFDTGIRLIDKSKFEKLSGDKKLFDDILNGKIENPQIISGLREKLKAGNAVIKVKTNALPLFCHHCEVTEAGRIPAALIVSDSMLLSLHKILKGTTQPGPIKSFLSSFNDNINALPQEFQNRGNAWKKEMLESYLQAADELNGRIVQDYSSKTIEEIENLYLQEPTWGEYSCFVKGWDSEKVDKMYEVLKKHYESTAEQSGNMFKINKD